MYVLCDAIFYQGEVVQRLKGWEDGSMVLVEKMSRDGDQNMHIYVRLAWEKDFYKKKNYYVRFL